MKRQLSLGVDGVRAEIGGKAMVIISKYPLRTLSSSVLRGGLTNARSIINYQVSKDFDHSQPSHFLGRVASRLKLPGPSVGLMTAANVRNASLQKHAGTGVATLVTAGISYPVAAGEEANVRFSPGTINTIIIIDAALSDGALVGAIKTATEAKTLALRDLDITSKFSKRIASGTTTDAIVVACTQRGDKLEYSGSATKVGHAIAVTVRAAVEEAIKREEGLARDRPISNRLEERGILLQDLVKTGMELFVKPSRISRSKGQALLQRGLREAMSDLNVASLILAALRLDDDGGAGKIPRLSAQEFRSDPVRLVADETIGMAIANYIAGTLGVHNFLRYDREKPGIMKTLGPFLDDAVGGLVAGVMTRALSEEHAFGT